MFVPGPRLFVPGVEVTHSIWRELAASASIRPINIKYYTARLGEYRNVALSSKLVWFGECEISRTKQSMMMMTSTDVLGAHTPEEAVGRRDLVFSDCGGSTYTQMGTCRGVCTRSNTVFILLDRHISSELKPYTPEEVYCQQHNITNLNELKTHLTSITEMDIIYDKGKCKCITSSSSSSSSSAPPDSSFIQKEQEEESNTYTQNTHTHTH